MTDRERILTERIEWLIDDYQRRVEDLEEDLKEQKVNMYLSGKLGVYAKVAQDLRDVLEEEDE